MKWVILALSLVCVSGCGEPLECTTDEACGDGQYCLETKCYPFDIVDQDQFRKSFRKRILPIIKAECGCHGPPPVEQRPWAFDHRPGTLDENKNFLKVEPWLRHRRSLDTGADLDAVPMPLSRYAAGLCGFNHPGVFDPAGAKGKLIDRWAKGAAVESLAPGVRPDAVAVDLEVQPRRTTFADGLQALERGVYEEAKAIAESEGEAAAMDAVIVPRVLGQCGCCHDQEPGYFDLGPNADPEKNRRSVRNFLGGRNTPIEAVAIVKYGLGDCLSPDCDRPPHPRVYAGSDDDRLHLLLAWARNGPVPEPMSPQPPDPSPPVGGDAGVPVGDGGAPPMMRDYLTEYTRAGGIADSLNRDCSAGGSCHGMASNKWVHSALAGPEDMLTIEANFAEMVEPIDGTQEPRVEPGNPASALLRYGAGQNHPFAGPYRDSPNLRVPIEQWISRLPDSFPLPPPPMDAAPPPMPVDAAVSVDAAGDAGPPSDGAPNSP